MEMLIMLQLSGLAVVRNKQKNASYYFPDMFNIQISFQAAAGFLHNLREYIFRSDRVAIYIHHGINRTS